MVNIQNSERVSGAAVNERPQPHNLEVERAVLAAMLREAQPCVDLVIEQLGSADAFYSHIHREIFNAINTLYNNSNLGVDLISVAHQLTKNGTLEDIGGEIFLAELYNSIATTANLEGWCDIIREFYILRNMINVCSESLLKCYDDSINVKELIDQIETDLFKVRNVTSRSDIVTLKETLSETFKNIQALINREVEIGIPTGLPDLDEMIGGMKPGEMFVLGARPSIGKTSLALNLIRNIAIRTSKPRAVAFFSLEMTSEQIARRLICTESGVPENRFFDGSFKNNEMVKLTQAVTILQKAKIFIDPTGGLTIAELRAKARRLKMMHNIDFIAIDYLQLMKADGRSDNRQQEVAEISSGIKKLAKDLNIPILVLAQLNREVEKTAGASARPRLSHLRESGSIEQDADIVSFLHRDRDESKSVSPEQDQAGLEAELILEKNRNGRTGVVKMKFHPSRMEFTNTRFTADDRPHNDA